jgi:hypothetical protein
MVKHYRLDKGTPCEVWGNGRWVPSEVPRMLFHVEAATDGEATQRDAMAAAVRLAAGESLAGKMPKRGVTRLHARFASHTVPSLTAGRFLDADSWLRQASVELVWFFSVTHRPESQLSAARAWFRWVEGAKARVKVLRSICNLKSKL